MPQSKALIAVCTFNRNQSLELLIGDLQRQEVGSVDARVVVIDNSPERAAENLVAELAKSSSITLDYVHEVRTGVSHARNRALDIASEQSTAVLFVDDDQRLDKVWLRSILEASEKHSGSIIIGPVIPIVNSVEATWCPNALCWQRPMYQDDQRIISAVGTGNILIPQLAIQRNGRFRPELNSGGEDTEYTMRWIQSGGPIYFCRSALSSEIVVRERLSPNYVAERIERSTYNWAMIWQSSKRRGLLIPIRLPLYFIQGCLNLITHPHRGEYGSHARIYFGRFIGMSRYLLQSKVLDHLKKTSHRKT